MSNHTLIWWVSARTWESASCLRVHEPLDRRRVATAVAQDAATSLFFRYRVCTAGAALAGTGHALVGRPVGNALHFSEPSTRPPLRRRSMERMMVPGIGRQPQASTGLRLSPRQKYEWGIFGTSTWTLFLLPYRAPPCHQRTLTCDLCKAGSRFVRHCTQHHTAPHRLETRKNMRDKPSGPGVHRETGDRRQEQHRKEKEGKKKHNTHK